jgi:glycosyltransferase involved in cell wall biosynthesis
MITKPWVSFCMSTYKRPKLLSKTIDSILNQTFQDFEIVISDNDIEASAKLIAIGKNDSRIKYHCNGSNLGMIDSFNKSIERATADYVVMITDDDPLYPFMLERLYDLYSRYPNYGVYHGGCNVLCETPQLAESLRLKIGINSCLASTKNLDDIVCYSKDTFALAFLGGNISEYLLWSVGVVKKSILLDIGGIPNYGSPIFGDLCFTILTGSHSGLVYQNTAFGHQTIHGKNFGYGNYKSLLLAPKGFYDWVKVRLQNRHDWELIDKAFKDYIGRVTVGTASTFYHFLRNNKIDKKELNSILKELFSIDFIRKWKFKYYLLTRHPDTFTYLLALKNKWVNRK